MSYPVPEAVEYLEDYKLLVFFKNGERRIFNGEPFLRYPFYFPLRDKELFKTGFVQGNTLGWDNDIDISPEDLYEFSVPLG